MKNLTIYCDGACSGNPGRAGSGLALFYDEAKEPILIYGKYLESGTNNIAELNALLRALQIAYKNLDEYQNITIKTDSKYSLDSITKWAYNWERNGWKKKGGEIKNLELIKKSFNLYRHLKDRVSIEYVKGHAGVDGNELADEMARFAIRDRVVGWSRYNN
ncbi:MAG: ribonuclease HI [Epsilonproteobacteria bacterium]|nr:ribonuclease HI [Campylobacterota bacterium]